MDIATLEWANLLFFFLYATVTFVSAANRSHTPGMLHGANPFALSNLCRGAATFLLLNLGTYSAGTFFGAKLLAATGLGLGLFLLHYSFGALLGRPRQYLTLQLMSILVIFPAGIILHLVHAPIFALQSLLGAMIALQTSMTAVMLFRYTPRGVRTAGYFTAILLAAYGAVHLCRISITLMQGDLSIVHMTMIWLVASLMLNGGTAFGFIFMGMSILRVELTRQAQHDPLTGLLNRRGLGLYLDRQLARVQRSGTPVAVITLDLDGMKAANDSYGHAAGDELLMAVANHLRSELRSGDAVARSGGDEFIVVLAGATTDEAEVLGERLRTGLAALELPTVETLHITASFGIAVMEREEKLDDLLKRSDRALYRAKREGRNRVRTAAGNAERFEAELEVEGADTAEIMAAS